MVIVVDSPSWGPPETSDSLDRLLVPSGVTLGPPSVYRLGYFARGFEWACRWAGCLSLVEPVMTRAVYSPFEPVNLLFLSRAEFTFR